jgi:hypothetical protein
MHMPGPVPAWALAVIAAVARGAAAGTAVAGGAAAAKAGRPAGDGGRG